nr:MAG TPA: hypothetical protein [Inoviridae sp.]
MFSTSLKAKSNLKPEPARKGRQGDPPKATAFTQFESRHFFRIYHGRGLLPQKFRNKMTTYQIQTVTRRPPPTQY